MVGGRHFSAQTTTCKLTSKCVEDTTSRHHNFVAFRATTLKHALHGLPRDIFREQPAVVRRLTTSNNGMMEDDTRTLYRMEGNDTVAVCSMRSRLGARRVLHQLL